MTIKVNTFEMENVKRVKAVKIEFTETGLNIIGGNNTQGKSSILDGLAWALGGDKFKPSNPKREGSNTNPYIKVQLNNGLIVERTGKNSSLKVLDPSGSKGGQTLLNEFIEQLALDLPKFINGSSKDKATTLLNILGIGEKLFELEQKETELFNERTAVGRIADQKEKYAKEMEYYDDVPEQLISAAELIKEQQEILARNGEKQRAKEQVDLIAAKIKVIQSDIENIESQITALNQRLLEKQTTLQEQQTMQLDAMKTAEETELESTAEIEASIENIETINAKITQNLDKEKATEEAARQREEYQALTAQIESIRAERVALLEKADLPLPELSVTSGELIYKGKKWDCMSGAEQLIVSTAIVRKLNPNCGFVLIDKLEQMDLDTIQHFGAWLQQEGLQVIATRVSKGEECSIIIEDGEVIGEKKNIPPVELPQVDDDDDDF